MSQDAWTAADIPDQQGRTAVITGANTGLGLATAQLLAERGAAVVLACRNPESAERAAARLAAAAPKSSVQVLPLDLGSLASVRRAADRLHALVDRVDLLINNAGVMGTAQGRTEDGFETQLGTNHLGHYAWTGLVLDLVLAAPDSRVVQVSSLAHRQGAIDFDDLHFDRREYRPMTAYAQSKLANLLFALELQRRLDQAGAATIALAAHPGIVHTELDKHFARPMRMAMRLVIPVLAQPDTAAGALPTLRAATDPAARGGTYYSVSSRNEWRGHPVAAEPSPAAQDPALAARLWQESERLTRVGYEMR